MPVPALEMPTPPTLPGERMPARRAWVVLLGGQPIAVDVSDAGEVIAIGTVTRVPGAPPAVLGVVNVRGAILPVVDIRLLLALPRRDDTGRGQALVFADGECRVAVVIEGMPGLTTFDAVQPPGGDDDRDGLVLGEVTGGDGARIALLDARAVLAALRRPWAAGRETV